MNTMACTSDPTSFINFLILMFNTSCSNFHMFDNHFQSHFCDILYDLFHYNNKPLKSRALSKQVDRICQPNLCLKHLQTETTDGFTNKGCHRYRSQNISTYHFQNFKHDSKRCVLNLQTNRK